LGKTNIETSGKEMSRWRRPKKKKYHNGRKKGPGEESTHRKKTKSFIPKSRRRKDFEAIRESVGKGACQKKCTKKERYGGANVVRRAHFERMFGSKTTIWGWGKRVEGGSGEEVGRKERNHLTDRGSGKEQGQREAIDGVQGR